MNLAELIRLSKGDRSYEELAEDSGGSPSRQRWQQLAAGVPVKQFPDPQTIRSIATTLGVSERAVVLAAARSAGLNAGRDDSLLEQMLPGSVRDLTDRQTTAVLSVVRAMLDPGDGAQGRGEEHAERSAPTKRAAGSAVSDTPDSGADPTLSEPHPDEDDERPRHWTPLTAQDIAEGASLPLDQGHGRKRRSSGRSKPKHN